MLTLASKNWQGSHAAPFQQYCGAWPDIDALQKLEQLTAKEIGMEKGDPCDIAECEQHQPGE
jgi:hypothetical protein